MQKSNQKIEDIIQRTDKYNTKGQSEDVIQRTEKNNAKGQSEAVIQRTGKTDKGQKGNQKM